jgi:hypothetical protein
MKKAGDKRSRLTQSFDFKITLIIAQTTFEPRVDLSLEVPRPAQNVTLSTLPAANMYLHATLRHMAPPSRFFPSIASLL